LNRIIKTSAIALTLAAIVIAAGPGRAQESQSRIVTYKDRKIDLVPYIEGFPYRGFTPSYDAGKLFFYKMGETTDLMQIDLAGGADLSAGQKIAAIDFSKRNVWGIRYLKNDGNLYWSGDEHNDEVINLYRLDPRTKQISRLTDVPYIFGWRWNPGGDTVAYVARLGHKNDRLGEVRVLDLASGEEHIIMKDTPAMRFTWTTPSWQPQGKGVVVTTLRDADRTYGNLVYVDFDEASWTVLTDESKARYMPSAYKEWLSDTELLYFSNEGGFRNMYRFDLSTGANTQVTRFDSDIRDAEMIDVDGDKLMFVVLSNPVENEIVLLDPRSGEEINREAVPLNLSVLDTRENRLLVYSTAGTTKFRIDEFTATRNGFGRTERVGLPAGLEAKIVHTEVERVEFPTFDIDPATGEPRKLHAFLYHPKNPLPKDEQLVMIQSFYGGTNNFSTRTQILAEAGIYVFSPSPRGSRGFGREFAALNDKDLGGNEIIDIIYAGRYISQRLGIPPERIGVYGGSHGGYATMRLLTFPGEINGTEADFDWGFGISHAGFSDIIHFYEHCNIPDWVTLEAGDPATEADKLRDRSPLYHADKAKGRLLLTHGTNDSRVPIEGSRQMADSLRKYDKDFVLVEFEDQGHGIKGLENNARNYGVWFRFLEELSKQPES